MFTTIRHGLVAALLALAAPAAAAGDDGVSLRPGESVTLQLDDAERLGVGGNGTAELSEFDQQALVALITQYPDAVGANAVALPNGKVEAPPVAPGAVRVSLIAIGDGASEPQMLLVLENGFGRAFRYRATLARGQVTAPTDVCTVLPGIRGYEHWPYPFDEIELSHLALVATDPGAPPVCE